MIRVKIIEPAINRSAKLEEHINSFLSQNDVEVVDIKYCTTSCNDSKGNMHINYSAMIIYKTND